MRAITLLTCWLPDNSYHQVLLDSFFLLYDMSALSAEMLQYLNAEIHMVG